MPGRDREISEQQLQALPPIIREKVYPEDRPINDGRNKRKRREAQRYVAKQEYQPQFSQMYTNSIAVWFAPEDDADSPYAFCVSLSRGTKSRWLNMGVVDKVNKTAKTISWKYLKPSKFSGPAKNKYLTSKVAENTKAWILSAEAVTSPWNDDEMFNRCMVLS